MDSCSSSPCYDQVLNKNKISKKCSVKISPEKLTFSGNFSKNNKLFDVTKDSSWSMRRNVLESIVQKIQSRMQEPDFEPVKHYPEENPTYEDPRDFIGEKPPKPPRKRNIPVEGITTSTSPSRSKEKSLMREQKRKLTKKYENLITTLIDRCEENIVLISQKDTYIEKLKEKLKAVLDYNKLFAEENDQLKSKYETIVKYIDDCKSVIRQERDKSRELEERCHELEERVREYEAPAKDVSAIPLVEVCMSCSSRQIILNQSREQNARLHKDMQALKDVLYRLNVQLSRYQEKVRSNVTAQATDCKNDRCDFDSLMASSISCKGPDTAVVNEHCTNKSSGDKNVNRFADMSGLLSAQALAPLFDAYQENLQEKDNLILDYEKQFENINKKSKEIVSENKCLSEKLACLEEELVQVRQSYKKAAVERETVDIEKATLLDRTEKAESKLKEVYELYEDKMAAMSRDYETVHREYYQTKCALEASHKALAALDNLRARTVPVDLHERRLDNCKRLLEELKHQYSMESERKNEQTGKLESQLRTLQEKYDDLGKAHDKIEDELKAALKNVRLYRKAAVIFRQRYQAACARAKVARCSVRKAPIASMAPMALEAIRREIRTVKTKAHTSLEELERRIIEQERKALATAAEYRKELERANYELQRKEEIIRGLMGKVADVEEVRLSQTNAQRLQGIISDSSPDKSPKDPEHKTVKLTSKHGGYYQDKETK